MKITLLLLLFVCLAGLLLACDRLPLRGLTGDEEHPVLISRARPSVLFAPAGDMPAESAGWRSLSPKTQDSLLGSARVWFVVYENATENGPAKLVTALAEAEDPWLWEDARHAPFPVLRQLQYEHKGEQLFESIYVMEPEDNPFYGAGMTDPCLVYRAKFLLDFRQMQVLVEYYEPVDSDAARDAAHDEARLNALRDRGRKACRVVFPDKAEQERLKKDFRKMSTADMDISRNRLSRWVGDMERNSHN